jgi:hypothetical protein
LYPPNEKASRLPIFSDLTMDIGMLVFASCRIPVDTAALFGSGCIIAYFAGICKDILSPLYKGKLLYGM